MNGSHGCAGRGRRARLAMALAASGLFAAWGPSPAPASPIRHDSQPAREDLTPPSASPAPFNPGEFQKALDAINARLDQLVPATPPQITPTAARATSPAAELIESGTPTVANPGPSQPCGCPPPPPPCPASAPAPSNTTHVTPPASAAQELQPPSALLTATPTPEPSTILSALAMIGAVAWRRRASRTRA